MNEQKFYELLRFNRAGSPGTEMTIKALTAAITESIQSRLVDTTMGAQGSTIVHLLDSACVLAKKGNELLFLAIVGCDSDGNRGYLEASTDAQWLFRLLTAEGLLYEVVPQSIADELGRLRDVAMAERAERILASYGIDNLDEWMKATHGVKPNSD